MDKILMHYKAGDQEYVTCLIEEPPGLLHVHISRLEDGAGI